MSMDLGGIDARKLWRLSRREYDRLVSAGAFEGQRLELLRGLLVRMSPQEPLHADTVFRLHRVLQTALGRRAIVRAQLPLVAADDSEPEPDLAVVSLGDYSKEHPKAALLAVEIADSSLRLDRTIKAALYAAMGVPEYWIVDLRHRTIEVFTRPETGSYADRRIARTGGVIRLVSLPRVKLHVASAFRPRMRGR